MPARRVGLHLRRMLAALLLILGTGASVLAAQFTTMSESGGLSVFTAPTIEPNREPNTGPFSVPFTVKNIGTTTLSAISLRCVRTGPVVCGTVTPSSRSSLAPGASFNVTVRYSVGAVGTGAVGLRAEDDFGATAYKERVVTVAPAGKPAVALLNPSVDVIDRGLCLTTGAGEAAGVSCGDLFIVHSMPAYRTLGRDRSLALSYNSAAAAGLTLVPATVAQPATIALPAKYKVVLTVGSSKDSAEYLPPAISPYCSSWPCAPYSDPQQVVLGRALAGQPTGIYPVTLSVQNIYPSSVHDTVVTGSVLVVNRSASEYGQGWSLLGVEQVLSDPTDSTRRVWLGGDGSIRRYQQATPGGHVFQGAPADAPDSLVRFDTLCTSTCQPWYRRDLKHGSTVTFDVTGRHRMTRNRVGAITTFAWDTVAGQPRLLSIVVPPNDGTTRTYSLTYDATTALLSKITDPAGRELNVTIASGALVTVVDPDHDQTSFSYTAGKMTGRTNRRGFTTLYQYAKGSRLTKVTVPVGRETSDTATAVTQLQPWDERGLAIGTTGQTAIRLDLVQSTVYGPRFPSVADTAAFQIDRWGAPTKITNAIGATTTIVRGNASNPALVTKVTYPNGRIVTMSYNGRGNLTEVRDSTTHLGSAGLPTKVTTYAYLSASAPDSPTLVADSIAGGAYRSQYTYTADGLTLTATDRRGHTTRFDTRASGTLRGVVDAVTELQVETWSVGNTDVADALANQVVAFTYDVNGNVIRTKSPAGVITSSPTDGMGRVTDVYDPLGFRQQWVYDALNRITQSTRFTAKTAHPDIPDPLQDCDASQVLCVDSTRAPAAALGTLLTTTYFHGDAGIDSVTDPRSNTRRFIYDKRGLLWQDVDEYTRPRIATYDRAGGLIQAISRIKEPTEPVPNPHRDTVTVQYDVLGRRTAVIMSETPYNSNAGLELVPADTIRYTYDVMDNVLTVRNGASTVTRAYYADGSLRTQKVTLPGGTDSVAYNYDATGARIRAARTSAGQTDVTTYAYNSATGDLQTMTINWGAPADTTSTLSFVWDVLGRRRQITYPNNMVVKFRYDKQGLLRRLQSANPANDPDVNDRFDLTYRVDSVDATGRILFQEWYCGGFQGSDGGGTGSACPAVTPEGHRTSNRYDRLNALVSQKSSATLLHTFEYDKAGNLILRQDGSVIHHYGMSTVSNRLIVDSLPGQTSAQVRLFDYTANGSREQEYTYNAATGGTDSKRMYYDGLGRPTGIRDFDHDGAGRSVCMTYDADGQLARPCDDNPSWLTYEGPNVAGTLGDRWVFVSGPGVDDPLVGLYRVPNAGTKEFYWVTDGQGQQLAVGVANGSLGGADENDYLFNGGKFAGGTQNANTFASSRFEPSFAPGFSHFRNRIYDQSTGRWTQEDPIGIAGGLNLYQFNGNNPVLNTDPFGLNPDNCCKNLNPLKAVVGAANVIRGATGAAAGATMVVTGEGGKLLGGVGAAVGVPVSAFGSARVAFGLANVNRGAQQISESLDDPNGPSAKNLLGLAPMGQKFDDPEEPSFGEYWKGMYEKAKENLKEAAKQAVQDFFAID